MLNSPAFESRKCLPRMGLPRSSFIIPQRSQPRSDPVWVIINCSQHSSSLAHRPSKLTALRSLFLLMTLFWKEKRKESNFQRRVGVFFSPFPPASFGRRRFTPTVELPQQWAVPSILHPQREHRSLLPGEQPSPAPHTASGGGGDSVPFLEGSVPPAWRASCPKCHPRPDSPSAGTIRDGQGQRMGMDETSRDQAGSSPSKTCQGSPGDPSLCSHPCPLPLPMLVPGTPWGQSQAVTCCHCD